MSHTEIGLKVIALGVLGTPQGKGRHNLKALCNPCHCRYDLQQMNRKQLLKRERHGQLRINGI